MGEMMLHSPQYSGPDDGGFGVKVWEDKQLPSLAVSVGQEFSDAERVSSTPSSHFYHGPPPLTITKLPAGARLQALTPPSLVKFPPQDFLFQLSSGFASGVQGGSQPSRWAAGPSVPCPRDQKPKPWWPWWWPCQNLGCKESDQRSQVISFK